MILLLLHSHVGKHFSSVASYEMGTYIEDPMIPIIRCHSFAANGGQMAMASQEIRRLSITCKEVRHPALGQATNEYSAAHEIVLRLLLKRNLYTYALTFLYAN